MSKVLKRFNDHKFNVEQKELEKLIPFVGEYKRLCKEIADASSLAEVELKLNEKSKFTNAKMSAMAYGLENEYARLLEIEKALDGKLAIDDVSSSNSLKLSVVNQLKQKHSTFFTDEELAEKEEIEKAIEIYNALDVNTRRKLFIDNTFKMRTNPMLQLW